ncbi:steroid 17-alpha-hydroxylase/17,20 lyase [Nematostella vectensis]|uniref:steroid 17-alpha-hydroxylase/17,20 lyase n=1 Tax=Nematostella vectensis TaxID=45351 RepID=UPI00207710A5|nr:steroid 17-alpha-hydroxylase/17,20 lyase [Nematostella vectensis]
MIAGILLACFASYGIYFVAWLILRKRKGLPPGPLPLPLIGNLHLLSSKPHLDLTRLGDIYGPIYTLNMGSQLAVVLNSYDIAKEALMKRGNAFAGRPHHFVGSKFSRDGKGVGFQNYTPTLRRQQKTIMKTVKFFDTLKTGESLQEIITKEVDYLCKRLLIFGDQSFDPRHEVTFAAGNVVGRITFGERYKGGNKEFWQLMESLTIFVEGLTATSFIDAFPFLKYVPFSMVKRVEKAVKLRDDVLNDKFRDHLKNWQNSTISTTTNRDLTYALIDEANKTNCFANSQSDTLTIDHVIMTMNDMIMAGSETPTMTLLWILYFLVKYPDVQVRAQKQVDDVSRNVQPLAWEGRKRLPYLEAFIAEVLRITGVMPLAIQHLAMADTALAGYHIPKGTTVIVNLWAMGHDPKVWDAPMEFRPERFLDSRGGFSTASTEGFTPYGMGLRSCPGEQLARMELFLFTVRLLRMFEFRASEALPEMLDAEFGITLRPLPFKIRAIKRH